MIVEEVGAMYDEVVAPPPQEREPVPELELESDALEINALTSEELAEPAVQPQQSGQSKKLWKFFDEEDFDKSKAMAKLSRTQYSESEPATYREAIEHWKYSKEWENVAKEEYDSTLI